MQKLIILAILVVFYHCREVRSYVTNQSVLYHVKRFVTTLSNHGQYNKGTRNRLTAFWYMLLYSIVPGPTPFVSMTLEPLPLVNGHHRWSDQLLVGPAASITSWAIIIDWAFSPLATQFQCHLLQLPLSVSITFTGGLAVACNPLHYFHYQPKKLQDVLVTVGPIILQSIPLMST